MAQQSPGASLSHYRIVSKLSAGGMSEVHLAQDTKLDRKIAPKILPADLAANQDRMRRFTQEAKTAAALNHPNIATIHEIGECDGVNFMARKFIDGATLREKNQAFAWLEMGFEDRSGQLGRIRWEPPFESLLSDPRYTDLLKRTGMRL